MMVLSNFNHKLSMPVLHCPLSQIFQMSSVNLFCSTLRCLLLSLWLIYKTDYSLPFREAFLKIVPSVFRPSDITPPFLLLNLSSRSCSHDTSHCSPLFPESTHLSGNAICKDQTRLRQRPGQLWVKWWVCPHDSVRLYSSHKGVPIQELVVVRCTVVRTVEMVLRSSVPPQKAILCSSWCYQQGSRDGSRDVRGQLNYASDT